MSITFEATYENGVLRPLTPVPFKENEKVTVLVAQERTKHVNPMQASYGMMGYLGKNMSGRKRDYISNFDTTRQIRTCWAEARMRSNMVNQRVGVEEQAIARQQI
jgi:predicted DNA-binding antitoxin AbrB/MazE fold protein